MNCDELVTGVVVVNCNDQGKVVVGEMEMVAEGKVAVNARHTVVGMEVEVVLHKAEGGRGEENGREVVVEVTNRDK